MSNPTAGYNEWLEYGQSKAANILFTVYLSQHLESSGIVSYSVHPGYKLTPFFSLSIMIDGLAIWTGLSRVLKFLSMVHCDSHNLAISDPLAVYLSDASSQKLHPTRLIQIPLGGYFTSARIWLESSRRYGITSADRMLRCLQNPAQCRLNSVIRASTLADNQGYCIFNRSIF